PAWKLEPVASAGHLELLQEEGNAPLGGRPHPPGDLSDLQPVDTALDLRPSPGRNDSFNPAREVRSVERIDQRALDRGVPPKLFAVIESSDPLDFAKVG